MGTGTEAVIDIDIHFGSGFSAGHQLTPPLVVRWRLALAPPCFNLSFLWVGFLCWSRPGCHTLGWRPWWDRPNCVEWWTHVELVFAERALRHAATASATIFSTMLGRLNYEISDLPARFLEATRSRSFRCRQSAWSRACEDARRTSGMQAEPGVLEDDPWVCMSWRPSHLRDRLKDCCVMRVETPDGSCARTVGCGWSAGSRGQEDGVALAGLQRAFRHARVIPGAELLQRLVQDRQLAF